MIPLKAMISMFVGALIVLVPNAPLMAIMWVSQVINGVMLLFVLVFMLQLVNRKDLMEDHTNSRLFNVIAWVTAVIMMVLTVSFVVSMFL